MTITKHHQRELETTASATYSPCELYRYELAITWSDGPAVMVVGLNPSTATERDNDPTITRLERWARRNGYGSLRMYNAYAYRTPYPHELWQVADPVGPCNSDFIMGAIATCAIPVMAWGTNIKPDYEAKLLEQLRRYPIFCFKETKHGHPSHPLYLSDETLDKFYTFNKFE